MSESWMKKHAKNLLSTMPVDDKASALHSHGPIDPKTGKKTHPGPGAQLDPSKFDYKSNPNDPRTGTQNKAYLARQKKNKEAYKRLTSGTPQERAAERARRANK